MMPEIRSSSQTLLVIAGYAAAFIVACVVVTIYIAATGGPDRRDSVGMFAFGDSSQSVTGAYLASRVLLRHYFEEMDPADEVFGFHR